MAKKTANAWVASRKVTTSKAVTKAQKAQTVNARPAVRGEGEIAKHGELTLEKVVLTKPRPKLTFTTLFSNHTKAQLRGVELIYDELPERLQDEFDLELSRRSSGGRVFYRVV